MKKKLKYGFTLIELLLLIAIVALVLALGGAMLGGCDRGDGTRAGTLQKFANKGMFVRSYEGTMLMGGLVQTSEGTAANLWRFSVQSPALAKELDALVGKQVKVRYTQSAVYNPLKQDTSYIVTEIVKD